MIDRWSRLRISALGAASTASEHILAVPTWAQAVAALVLVAFYADRVWSVYRDSGLFRRIGFDWGLFYSQAAALAAGDVGAMYRVDRLGEYVQALAPYTTTPDIPLLEWPSPYPPVLAGVLQPLTHVSPPVAFGIWTVFSLLCAAHLMWRASQLLPTAGPIRLVLIFFTTLPVIQAFVLGQPVLFLASAVAESFLALRKGADFRGGVWLGLLALKPQYGLLLGLFVLWKQRWLAVVGAAVGVAVVLLASSVAAGPGAILDYLSGVSAMGDFRDPYASAAEMVNWRALIVNARPSIGDTSGLLLFVSLSILTLLVVAWRIAHARQLDFQLAVVTIATFLVSYHSHMHGLVLLTVPLAALWGVSARAPLTRLAIIAFVFAPTAVFVAVAGIGHGFTINYDEPLWVVWPVFNVLVLLALLIATIADMPPVRTNRKMISPEERRSTELEMVPNA